METIGTTWMWISFFAFIIVILLIDLYLLGGRKAHQVSFKEAAAWSTFWVMLALLFNLALWWYLEQTAGREQANIKALEFLTGYLVEKSLAIDNVFVWLMLFTYFTVPPEYQQRVLLYGVFGALLMRTVMILLGAWLLAHFHWILYVFGGFLVFTGIKMLWFSEHQPDLEQNPLVRWLRSHMRVTTTFHQERFFVMQDGVRYITPLFMVLVLVEISDLIFAVDSIPAVFAITNDPFIVLTSNIFAILGLRAMYFLLVDFANRFVLLKYGLALVLVFIGCKMLLLDVYKIPITWSLLVVASIIAISAILSVRYTRNSL